MGRNFTEDAVVTGLSDYGEIHRTVNLYTRSRGVVTAVIYGGRKGKNVSKTPLFSYGHYVLTQPTGNGRPSLAEEDTVFTPVIIKQDIVRTYTALYFCETAERLQTQDTSSVFSLLVSAITELESSIHSSSKILSDYTWSLIKLCGLAPDLQRCPSCDAPYTDSQLLGFSSNLCSPVCSRCSDCPEPVLLPGIRRYMRYTSDMTFEQALDVEMYPQSVERLKSFMLKYISHICLYRLKTVSSGIL